MIEIVEQTAAGCVLGLNAAELYLLHGALREAIATVPDPHALGEDPRVTGDLLLGLGEVLSWMADPQPRRRRGSSSAWYWAQWIPVRDYPERLAGAGLYVELRSAELATLRVLTPVALEALGESEWETRVGCLPEQSRAIHDELVEALDHAGL